MNNNENQNRNQNNNNNPNVNMYFPPSGQQNIPVQQSGQQGYGYGAGGQQNYAYPVPQVNPEEAHHEERGTFVLPESAKIMMTACAIFCFLIFIVLVFLK